MSKQDKPKFADYVVKIDLWLLDKFFQPIADRLPERLSAVKVGMNLQLGSLVFSAGSLILLFMVLSMSVFNMLFNILAWFLGVLFYASIHRMHHVVKVGHLNPFRFMLSGIRSISIPFAIYSVFLGATAEFPYREALLFNSISNTVFVFGIYLISCQPNPPPEKKKQTVFSMNEG